MLDHIKLHVADAGRSKAFYEQALAPLGYRVIRRHRQRRARPAERATIGESFGLTSSNSPVG